MSSSSTKILTDTSLTSAADAAPHRHINFSLSQTRAEFGQFMTPGPIPKFMAQFFTAKFDRIRILDPGAGVGTLTAAKPTRCLLRDPPPTWIWATCFEIDSRLLRSA